jgi:hypothetical protein
LLDKIDKAIAIDSSQIFMRIKTAPLEVLRVFAVEFMPKKQGWTGIHETLM